MANRQGLNEAIDLYFDSEADLATVAAQAVVLGYLMVPRSGSQPDPNSLTEQVREVGDNSALAAELGLNPGEGLILATSHVPEGVIAALYCDGRREPLSPIDGEEGSDYGWNRYSDNVPPDNVPWVAEFLRPNPGDLVRPGRRLGRLVFVEADDFMERGDMPGHYFRAIGETGLEGVDAIFVSEQHVLDLANNGSIVWEP